MDAVLKMRMQEGSSGYGIYIMLLELLRDSEDLRTAYEPSVLAWALHESDIERLTRVCENYDLFQISDTRELTCPWLNDIMNESLERKQKLSAAGKKSQALRKAALNEVETTFNNRGGGASSEVSNLSQQTTLYNNTTEKPNKILDFADLVKGERVYSEESIKAIGRSKAMLFGIDDEALRGLSDSKHNLCAVGNVARHFKLNVDQFTALKIATDDARIGSPELIALLGAYNNCKETDFAPKYPYEYLMSRIVTAHNNGDRKI